LSGSGNPVSGLIKTGSSLSSRTRAKTCSTGLVGVVGGAGGTSWLWSSTTGFTGLVGGDADVDAGRGHHHRIEPQQQDQGEDVSVIDYRP
jgi:hypothetical protein